MTPEKRDSTKRILWSTLTALGIVSFIAGSVGVINKIDSKASAANKTSTELVEEVKVIKVDVVDNETKLMLHDQRINAIEKKNEDFKISLDDFTKTTNELVKVVTVLTEQTRQLRSDIKELKDRSQ